MDINVSIKKTLKICLMILSPFTGRKKQEASNKTREKYVPEVRRQNLAETKRGSYIQSKEMVIKIIRQ